jgi:hypothetical protein
MQNGSGSKPRLIALSMACAASIAMLTVSAPGAQAASAARVSATGVAARPDSGGGDGCNPGRANNYRTFYWAGADSENPDNGTLGGVYATIVNYSPFVAGTNQGAPSTDAVSEWVMLYNSGNADDYAQIGWVEFPGGTRDTLTQTSDGSNLATKFFAPYTISSQQSYAALYQPGNADPYVLSVDGVDWITTNLSWTPDSAQINTEDMTQASQIPGGTADPPGQVATVSGAHVWPNAGQGGWENFDGFTGGSTSLSPPVPPSWMGIAPEGTNINTWRTWDKACTE